mmetsp:Transcript_8082/g.10455  ORF Transcript_8082/g.10455 Transcript_8082/m.10455 type:complete len:176 (+) Transcript_8082:1-528(+)
MVLFAAAVPITPLLMLPLTLIRKYCDGSRLIYDFRRPLPISTATIGAWNGVLQILSRITMMSNIGIVLFTLHGMAATQSMERNMVYAEAFGTFLGFCLIVFKPATESFAIKGQRLREQHIVATLRSMSRRYDEEQYDFSLLKNAHENDTQEPDTPDRKMKQQDSFVAAVYHHYAV